MKYNEYGHYSSDNLEYITERKTPRHWYNYFFNDTYISFASQVAFGEGFCQDTMGNRVPLINDRCLYLVDQDTGTFHTANGLPMTDDYDHYECHHGLGYSTIYAGKNGIHSEYTIFVPAEGNFEQWIVKVTNHRDRPLSLGTIAYCANQLDGPYTPQGFNIREAGYDKDLEAICSHTSTSFDDTRPHVSYGYMMSDHSPSGYDARVSAFIGVYGSKEAPRALLNGGRCTNSYSCMEKGCQALEISLRLEPGQSETMCFQIGYAREKEDIRNAKAYLQNNRPLQLLAEMIQQRTQESCGVTIQTPDEKLNKAFNSFYKYSANMCSRWARVRHNGYRDLCSDTECFGAINPELAWKRFTRILTYQYANGYAPRTFIDGKVQPKNASDCAVWIPFTAYALIMELGDLSLLDEEVAFNDGTKASVFEHLRRAVQFLYDFKGLYDLIQIWGCDWHDSLNRAGLEGKGVSVWLSIAWYRANKMFTELASLKGEAALVQIHTQMGETMRQLIETYGWDGKYYLQAYNDLGQKIGSKDNEEGKMYLLPQLWAVFAGIAPKEKLEAIMKEVDDYLETPLGTLVNRPAYTKYDPYIGNITAIPAGNGINGAVYSHPMAWKIAVEGIMKRPDKLQMTLEKALPWNHKYCMKYGEPYILYNYYNGPSATYHEGTPGQTWRTATTGWVVKSLINYAFGLKPGLDGLSLDPCLPPDWKECAITKQFRGCEYHIRYHQRTGSGCIVEQILVNGQTTNSMLLPYEKGALFTVDVYLK